MVQYVRTPSWSKAGKRCLFRNIYFPISRLFSVFFFFLVRKKRMHGFANIYREMHECTCAMPTYAHRAFISLPKSLTILDQPGFYVRWRTWARFLVNSLSVLQILGRARQYSPDQMCICTRGSTRGLIGGGHRNHGHDRNAESAYHWSVIRQRSTSAPKYKILAIGSRSEANKFGEELQKTCNLFRRRERRERKVIAAGHW